MRQHASELNIDPDRIGVYAASGNAFRGLPVIEDQKRNWIKAAAIYYGAADIAQFRPEIPLLWIRAGLDRPQMNRQIDEAVSKAIRQNVTVAVVSKRFNSARSRWIHPGARHSRWANRRRRLPARWRWATMNAPLRSTLS